DIISIVFDKSSKEFSFYYDDKNDITVLIKRLELESYIEDIECKFNISMKVNKLGKLIKYYNNSDNKKIAKLCDSLKIEQELIGKCIESTVDNSDCVNLECKESSCIGKTESNVIYKGGNGLYLVKSQKDNNFVTIVHDNVAEILKQMLDSRNALSNKPIISESTKKDTPIYIFLALIFISMIVMLVGIYTPLKPGKTGVILTLMKTGGGAVFFALIVIFILFSNRKPDAKTKKDLVFVCGISFLAIILLIYLSYNGIKALGGDTKEITSNNYSVERSMVFLSRDRLLLKVNSGNETISIEVTKSMYKELRNSNKPIKVTYYPYINIVNDIQYLE
nr:hypothetical protein [Lachnospiraceae bacterium]